MTRADIWEILESIRPRAKIFMTALIQAEDLIRWKKKRIARVRQWMSKRGR